jgi:chromosome partitioning protein
MRIWSFVQQKGGSGKSTIATNLGVCGEEEGETVLIVDLDPQHSATLWHSARGTNKPTVIDAIPEKLTNIVTSAPNLGVTLCLIDSPSKLDDIALAAIRVADMVVCPTLPDLFNLGSLQDTVHLLKAAEKLGVTVGVINNVDKAGGVARIGEATAVMEKFDMAVCPQVIHHRSEFQTAAEKGKAVIELGAKGKAAADEIRALWDFLDGRASAKRPAPRARRIAHEIKNPLTPIQLSSERKPRRKAREVK